MKILISGASGFVGRHVVDALTRAGHELALARLQPAPAGPAAPNVSWICGSLDDPATIRDAVVRFAPDACVHLAWSGIPDYSPRMSAANLRRSIALFQLLLEETPCRRIVGSGSCMEYGRQHGECVETDPVQLTSAFSWAKQSIREYLEVAALRQTLEVTWLRLFYVYGPGQRGDSLLPTLITNVLRGQDPTILNPYNAQDFVYVADVADAVRLSLEPDAVPGTFNVGSGQATSVLDMCRLAEACLGTGSRVSEILSTRPRPDNPARFWASTATAERVLRWKAAWSLADGVRSQVESIRSAALAAHV